MGLEPGRLAHRPRRQSGDERGQRDILPQTGHKSAEMLAKYVSGG